MTATPPSKPASEQGTVADLLAAAKAAKKYLEPDLVEPGRTVFWNLVEAIKRVEAAAPEPAATACCKGLAPLRECQCETDRLAASPPSPGEVRVKALTWRVKELEWRDGRNAETVFSVVQIATILGADNLVGLEYMILGPDRHGLYETILGAKIIATRNDEETAKAAAQADYESRIRSALASDATANSNAGDEDVRGALAKAVAAPLTPFGELPGWAQDRIASLEDIASNSVKALGAARETIRELVSARWSESEGTPDEWTAELDAALAMFPTATTGAPP